MSTTPETKLVGSSNLVAQVTQPFVRTELAARPAESPAVGKDSLDERLKDEMSNRWGDFMARAEASLGEAPLPTGAAPVKKATSSTELIKTSGAAESTLPAPTPPPSPTPSEPAPAPPQQQAPARRSGPPAQEAPRATPTTVREERPSHRPAENGRAGRPEETRHEVARDRAQLEARAAETEQQIALDEQAALVSEQEAERYASLASDHESNLTQERSSVERRRETINQDRALIERKALDAERAAGLLDNSNPLSSSLQFWSTLAREGELDRAAFEARRLQEQLDRRDEQAFFRIERNLEAARNGNFGADLSGHGLNEGTRAEVSLYQLQRRMERLA